MLTAFVAASVCAGEAKKAPAKAPSKAPTKAPAKPRPAGSRMRISGDVVAARTSEGALVGVTITTVNRVPYDIVLDEKGKALAAAMAGKRAWAMGYCVIDVAKRTFTVESYGELGTQSKTGPAKPPVAPAKSKKTSPTNPTKK